MRYGGRRVVVAAVGAHGHARVALARRLDALNRRRRKDLIHDLLPSDVVGHEALEKDSRRDEIVRLEHILDPRAGACPTGSEQHLQASVACFLD